MKNFSLEGRVRYKLKKDKKEEEADGRFRFSKASNEEVTYSDLEKYLKEFYKDVIWIQIDSITLSFEEGLLTKTA